MATTGGTENPLAKDAQRDKLFARIQNDFCYHAPFGDQALRYEALRDMARKFAIYLADNTPASREQSLALTSLEEAVFWANASIARNERPPEVNPNRLRGGED